MEKRAADMTALEIAEFRKSNKPIWRASLEREGKQNGTVRVDLEDTERRYVQEKMAALLKEHWRVIVYPRLHNPKLIKTGVLK